MYLTQDEWMRAQAKLKSYSSQVVLVLILYLFLFIPGLIANWLFYREAERFERIAGENLPGVSCLYVMLMVALGAAIAGVLAAAWLLGALPHLFRGL